MHQGILYGEEIDFPTNQWQSTCKIEVDERGAAEDDLLLLAGSVEV